MAKLRIVGMNEGIEVSDEKAREFTNGRKAGTIGDNDYVSIGPWYGKAREVRGVWVTPEVNLDPHGEMLERIQNSYIQERRRLQGLSPEKRADRTAWGYFGLLYWGISKETAPENMKPKVLKLASSFYKSHPYWTTPSISCWKEFFKGRSMNAFVVSISERVEGSQAQMSMVDERSIKIK